MKKKYKNGNDFAEKVVNDLPFMQNMNIKVEVGENNISFKPIEGETFSPYFASQGISFSFMDRLLGIIDGLRYAWEIIEKGRRVK